MRHVRLGLLTMNKILLFPLLAIGLVQPAVAVRITAQPESAYELTIPDVVLPIASPGILGLANCANCAAQTLQLVASTTFFIGTRQVEYEELRDAIRQLRTSTASMELADLSVFFDVGTRRVNRMRLKVFAAQ